MRYTLILVLALFNFTPASAQENCPRIISQSPYITHTLEWLGLRHCIVGTSRYDSLGLPTTGGVLDPDKQAIDALMPDVIFTSDWTKPETLTAITPTGAHAYILHGFQTMQQVEENLHTIAQALQRPDLENKAAEFTKAWHTAAARLNGKGTKVLLISSCGGSPYSFGRQTWLYDLFTKAGFQVVETEERIRHLKPGNEIEEIGGLLDTFQPELLFIFERTLNPKCNLITPKVPVRILSMDGELFLHPAPVILKGLDALYEKRTAWER